MRTKHLIPAAALGVAVACGSETRVNPDAFRWRGVLHAGDTLHVWSSRGDVAVTRAPDSVASVVAEARWSEGGADEVTFAQTDGDGGAYVCAFWGERGRCDARGYDVHRGLWRKLFRKDSDMRVRFSAQVPDGVVVDVRTTRGGLTVDAAAPVRARTVDGDIAVRTALGPVRARTTNGDIDVTMDSVFGTDSVYLATTHGDVTLTAGPSLAGRVELHSSNGAKASDWPMLVSGEVRRRDLAFAIGTDSARMIRLRTTDGDVRLRRAGGPPPVVAESVVANTTAPAAGAPRPTTPP
jgi:hypothetical protein